MKRIYSLEQLFIDFIPLEEPCVSGNSKVWKFHYLFGKDPFLHEGQCQWKSDMKTYMKYITDSPQISHFQKLAKHALYLMSLLGITPNIQQQNYVIC